MVLSWKTLAFVLILYVRFNLARECGSIDVRIDPKSLEALQGCTVIKGFVVIVLIQRNVTMAEYEKWSFPELKEITEYLMLYEDNGLTSLSGLFPNLTVIRGQKLFLNYALGIHMMPDLETINLKSLVAIQRGHVFIAKCPKLCYLEHINWDRLTLARGENHIRPSSGAVCPKNECRGCINCWSNFFCQKSENDNLERLTKGSQQCHRNCLGGCTGPEASDCRVCRGITDHGVCVDRCPKDKYLVRDHQRCYNETECLSYKRVIFEGDCRKTCPTGYTLDNSTSPHVCTKCPNGCPKVCEEPGANVNLQQLSDFENIEGCEIINSSLIIRIRNLVEVGELIKYTGKLRVINGYLKVHRSPYLTSLSFLGSLEKITGSQLEHDHYGIVIYDNKKLKEFWTHNRTVELSNGGIYIHSNNKLCNRKAQEFQATINGHDKKLDSIQINEQEVECDPIRLELQYKVLSHDSVNLYWKRDQAEAENEVEFLYKPIGKNRILDDTILDDEPVCSSIPWTRILIPRSDLQLNQNFFQYNISNLKSSTRYVIVLKTFSETTSSSSQSALLSFTTFENLPSKVDQVTTLNKTMDSITLTWSQSKGDENLNHYLVEIYSDPDRAAILDSRDFCTHPKVRRVTSHDYDDCCLRMEDAMEEDEFEDNLNGRYPCSLDGLGNCDRNDVGGVADAFVQTVRVPANVSTVTFANLDRYTPYIFKMYACNVVGCGDYTMHHDRTNLSVTADRVTDLNVCSVGEEYQVRFGEPSRPNGVIVSYTIHFRMDDPDQPDEYIGSRSCITRVDHELNGNVFRTKMRISFEEVAIRSNSLAGTDLGPYVAVRVCPAKAKSDFSLFVTFMCLMVLTTVGVGLYYANKHQLWPACSLQSRFMQLLAHYQRNANGEELLMEEFETVRFEINDDEGYSD